MASPRTGRKSKGTGKGRSRALARPRAPTRSQALGSQARELAPADPISAVGTLLARCAEMPFRLLRARSPLEVWQEQMRLAATVATACGLASGLTPVPAAPLAKAKKPNLSRRRKR